MLQLNDKQISWMNAALTTLFIFGLIYATYSHETTAFLMSKEDGCSHFSFPDTQLVQIEEQNKERTLAFVKTSVLKTLSIGQQVNIQYYPGVPYPTIQGPHQWLW